MTSDETARRPQSVSPQVWDWVSDNLPAMPAFLAENPLSTVVLAARHQDRNNRGPAPDEVLHGWSRLIDAGRRTVNQAEGAFIEQARAAGWADDHIRAALLLPPDADLDARVVELDTMVSSRERPPSTWTPRG